MFMVSTYQDSWHRSWHGLLLGVGLGGRPCHAFYLLLLSRSELLDETRTPIDPSAWPDIARSIGVLSLSSNQSWPWALAWHRSWRPYVVHISHSYKPLFILYHTKQFTQPSFATLCCISLLRPQLRHMH